MFTSGQVTCMLCCLILSIALIATAETMTKSLYKTMLAKACVEKGWEYTESFRGTPLCTEVKK